MASIVIDTHVLVWYLVDPASLSAGAMQALSRINPGKDMIYASSISIVEIAYLVEKGKLPEELLDRLDALLNSGEVDMIVVPLDLAIARAVRRIPREDVPDLPDRVIAATALHLGLPLLTRDNKIRTSGVVTIW